MITSIDELKNKFLKTNYFIDNKYLDLYLNLINVNLNRKKEKYKTSRHHIFPIALSKILKLDIDNSNQNLVNLLHKDHLLSHYYLALCSLDEFKYKMCCALYFLCGHIVPYSQNKITKESLTSFLDSLDEYQNLQEYYKQEASIRNKGKKISQEITQKCKKSRQKTISERGYYFTEETRQLLSDKQRGRICIKKDNQYKRVYAENLQSYLDDGWELGNRPCPESLKEKLKLKTQNGHQNKRYVHKDNSHKLIPLDLIEEYLDNGWQLGRLTSNEGKENIRSAMLKRDYSYMKGKVKSEIHRQNLSKALKGKIWLCKDGNIKMINPEEEQFYLNLGYHRGRK